MSRGYWIIVVAFGLIVSPYLGQAQQHSDQTNREADQESDQAYKLPFTIGVDVVEKEAATKARERHEAEAREREKRDLVAQEGMNAATKEINAATQAMAAYAYWSTAFVGIGTALLFLTLYLTHRANQGAHSAVKVTREIGEAQVRAYVEIDDIKTSYEQRSGERAAIRSFVNWINTGQSPTRNLVWAIDHHLGLLPDNFAFVMSETATHGTSTIGAGRTSYDVSHLMDRTGLDEFDKERLPITLFGYVDYDDVFPDTKRHRTEFCVELARKGVAVENSTCSKHNGADDGCFRQPTT
ncbi:hypothetical protein AB3G45_23635 [Shinella sp. S4-D37]|uniref:hypothetical protein n=1 Tax=Shinella sp. S4-D37 TaxID=3161999 RepID=UPI003465F35E